MFVVFSQSAGELAPFQQLSGHASRFFASELELLAEDARRLEVRLKSDRPRLDQAFTIQARDTTLLDRTAAQQAEARGRAFGMAELAARCPRVWELTPSPPIDPSLDAAWLTLCAICASVALGPVLPADHSTLFGVRGSIERRNLIASS